MRTWLETAKEEGKGSAEESRDYKGARYNPHGSHHYASVTPKYNCRRTREQGGDGRGFKGEGRGGIKYGKMERK